MENSGRPHRSKQGSWERGAAAADKEERWRIHDQVQGQNLRPEGGQQGKKNQAGTYRASPKKGGLGPLSYSPVGIRGGHSPSQRDNLRWFSGPDNSAESQDDYWREFSREQHWRRSAQARGPKEDREQGRRETTDGSAPKSGEDFSKWFLEVSGTV